MAAINQPKGMTHERYVKLVQAVDILTGSGNDDVAQLVVDTMSELYAARTANDALRKRWGKCRETRNEAQEARDRYKAGSQQEKRLRLEVQSKLEDREAELHTVREDYDAAERELRSERMRAEECDRQLYDANREAERLEGELQDRVEAYTNERAELTARIKALQVHLHEAYHVLYQHKIPAEEIYALEKKVTDAMDREAIASVAYNPWLAHAWEKYVLEAKDWAPQVIAKGNQETTNMSDQTTINELAFTCSTSYLRGKLLRIAEECEALTKVESALICAAGDRLGVDTWPGSRALRQRPTSKGELAKGLYPEEEGYTVDCAVPANWLNDVYERLDDDTRKQLSEEGGLASHFVTVYDHTTMFGTVMPITRAGIHIMAGLAR